MIIGLIGKPNTGKSTFFNAATLKNVPTGNYPFTTIDPNIGITHIKVKCPCKELDIKDEPVNSKCIDGFRFIPVEIVDLAGLVPDASKGKGLGNKFLDNIRMADVLIHVIDTSGSTDKEGKTIEIGSHNPIEDIKFVREEFNIWLKSIIDRHWTNIVRSAKNNDQLYDMLSEKLIGIGVKKTQILESVQKTQLINIKPIEWKDNNLQDFINTLQSITKPIVIAANKIDVSTSKTYINELKKSGLEINPCAAEAELLLKLASDKKIIEYSPGDSVFKVNSDKIDNKQNRALELIKKILEQNGSTGIQNIINKAYLEVLNCIVVYPVEDENKLCDKKDRILPDAHILKKGSTAKDLAYKIHTDIGKTFLYAINARLKIKISGEYELKNNDVIKIVASNRKS